MSAQQEDDLSEFRIRPSKRETQRACDECRGRKVRCDGAGQQDRVCSPCKRSRLQCTYVEQSARRAPPKAYVQTLEAKLWRTEGILRRLIPDIDFSKDLEGINLDQLPPITLPRAQNIPPKSALPWTASAALTEPASRVSHHHQDAAKHPQGIPADFFEPGYMSDDERVVVPLTETEEHQGCSRQNRTKIFAAAGILRTNFIGKSTVNSLVEDVVMEKHRDTKWSTIVNSMPTNWKRGQFWKFPAYEHRHDRLLHAPSPDVILPPPDLLHKLIDAYFEDYNLFVPLLHRKLLLRQLNAGLHESDPEFLAVVLLMCALGSRSLCLKDDRVLTEPREPCSAGWQYFEMAEPMNRLHLWRSTRLFDLQIKVLTVFFLWGSSAPTACWIPLGVAIRSVLEVGAHRRKLYRDTPNLIDELWKRTFWTVVGLDRSLSAAFGRACALQDESIDAELPLEVDDDCWDVSDEGAQHYFPLMHTQPVDTPSYMSFFVAATKLRQILTFAKKTLYSINTSRTILGLVGDDWEQRVLSELNARMIEWATSVPEHLQWQRDRTDMRWFRQSAMLWSLYHHIQLIVHGPSISYFRRTQGARRVQDHQISVSVCLKAADAAIDIISVYLHRLRPPYDGLIPYQSAILLMSCLVLLLAAWTQDASVGRSGEAADEARSSGGEPSEWAKEVLRRVNEGMDVLKLSEDWWLPSGKAWDILNELSSGSHSTPPSASSSAFFPKEAGPLDFITARNGTRLSPGVVAPHISSMRSTSTELHTSEATSPSTLDGAHLFSAAASPSAWDPELGGAFEELAFDWLSTEPEPSLGGDGGYLGQLDDIGDSRVRNKSWRVL
ncbi:fungal-specific transcription factor domain-containing protein [Auriculariales sp. MPI-PUGE-AT-0066]|nr:fungal-specific transcription factor domain-containing protein [Auriculariales sp. MPI-PUGE-AT-0066]